MNSIATGNNIPAGYQNTMSTRPLAIKNMYAGNTSGYGFPGSTFGPGAPTNIVTGWPSSNTPSQQRTSPNPINFYAKTKYFAENYIKKTLKKYIIIRTNFFSLLDVKSTFLRKIFILSKKKNPPIIKLWSNVYFTPVHASTIVDIVYLLLEKKLYGIFNISSNEVLSKFDFYSLVKKTFRLDKLIFLSTIFNTHKKKNHTVKRPLNMSLNNKKIKNIFPYLNSRLNIKKQILMLKKVLKSNITLSKC